MRALTAPAPPRRSDAVASQIRWLVRTGQLSPGDRLPGESQLREQFGAGRVTIREALRILQARGLVRVQVGAGGGTFVTALSPAHVAKGIADLLATCPATPAQIAEARAIVDRGIVPLICERATGRDIAELREMCSRPVPDGAGTRGAGHSTGTCAAFHARAARAVHNPAVTLLADSFHGPLGLSAGPRQHLAPGPTCVPDQDQQDQQEHLAFAEAVAGGRARDAATIMSRHLQRALSRLPGRERRPFPRAGTRPATAGT